MPQINSLTTQIAQLNTQIAQVTDGGSSPSTGNGLTDQRDEAISELSQLVGIQTFTQPDGTVSVYNGGNYLVDEGTASQVDVAQSSRQGTLVSSLQIVGINAPLQATSGQLQGLVESRDDAVGGFEDQLNSFAGTLINEFNKIYSGGQGTSGYTQTTSLNSVSDPNASINQSGLLPFTPTNGSFNIIVTNTNSGTSTTTNIPVSLLGAGHDTSLNSLAAEINKVSGLKATVANGKLNISAVGANTQFAFSDDTSGTLAALGINTFFTGSQASDIGVNDTVLQDPTKFAASSEGIGTDTSNAQTLAGFLTYSFTPPSGSATTIQNVYNTMTANVTQASANATAASTAADTLQSSLSGQNASVSGVNIDDQVIDMMNYQEAYQASAKFISTLSDLLNMLVQL